MNNKSRTKEMEEEFHPQTKRTIRFLNIQTNKQRTEQPKEMIIEQRKHTQKKKKKYKRKKIDKNTKKGVQHYKHKHNKM